jgi:hypothetical protein
MLKNVLIAAASVLMTIGTWAAILRGMIASGSITLV